MSKNEQFTSMPYQEWKRLAGKVGALIPPFYSGHWVFGVAEDGWPSIMNGYRGEVMRLERDPDAENPISPS